MILTRSALLASSVCLVLAACGGEAVSDEAESAPIVATTSIWADITSEVLCGLDVPSVIPTGADVHTFELSLRDRETLEVADLVIANGGGLEGQLTDVLEVVASGDTNVVEITPWVDTIAPNPDASHHDHGGEDHDDHDSESHDESHDHESHDDHDGEPHDESHDHDDHDDEAHDDEAHGDHDDDPHGHDAEIDPHVWHDPRRVATALDVIVSAAAALDVDDCADDYRERLDQLDRDIIETLQPISDNARVMVTSHDSLGYFADRYGFDVVGTVIPATNTLAETNAADLAELAELIDERGVRAIFTDAFESSSDADALAERLGVQIVPLVTDALTGEPGGDSYLAMMRSNAEAIAAALAP